MDWFDYLEKIWAFICSAVVSALAMWMVASFLKSTTSNVGLGGLVHLFIIGLVGFLCGKFVWMWFNSPYNN